MVTSVGPVTKPEIVVVDLSAEQTHELRRALLRDGTASDDVSFDGDDLPATFHLGATVGGELVTIATWIQRRYPDLPGHAGHQLRGMATRPNARGSGVSASVLAEGLRRCRVQGSSVVWARARVSALSFYERHGFECRGDEYVDLTTGLPHRDILTFI